jgi:hypothetical protein
MPRRLIGAALLGALVLVGSAVPGPGLVQHAAAASCSGWTSNAQPPPTVRVFRHESGAVEVVDFKAYTKNVLSREWIGWWTTESLRSGALAVKNYAWYQVLHWRGQTNAAGECFDLRDDTWDQVYDPSQATWATAATAVDDTWTTLVLKSGAIFPTYYNAGDPYEACGANANGWKAFQWGTQGCGLAGLSAAQIILSYYYPNVTVSGSSATPTPPATPTPSPSPTVTPSPTPSATATPSPTTMPATPTPGTTATLTASPSPMQLPTPIPTPVTTPSPAPTPQAPAATPAATATPASFASPPTDQQLPGGGQRGVEQAAAPPAPPPAAPAPVVVRAEPVAVVSHRAARTLQWASVLERLQALDGAASTSGSWQAIHRAAGMHLPSVGPGDLRLAAFQLLWRPALDDLVAAISRGLGRAPRVAHAPPAND